MMKMMIFEEFMQSIAESIEDDFSKVVAALTAKKIPCKVQLVDDGIHILCGWNYPDRLADKIFDELDKLDLDKSADVSAEYSGGKVNKSVNIAGGPKRY